MLHITIDDLGKMPPGAIAGLIAYMQAYLPPQDASVTLIERAADVIETTSGPVHAVTESRNLCDSLAESHAVGAGQNPNPASGTVEVAPVVNTAAIFGGTPDGGVVGAPAGSATVLADAVAATITGAVVMPAKDSQGVPHDMRIHASTKGQNKDGSWKRRKGVDDAEFARVMGELTAAAIAGTSAAFAQAATNIAQTALLPPAQNVAPPPPPTTPVTNTAGALPPVTDVNSFFARVTAAGITAADVIAACQAHGLATVGLLVSARPDLAPAVAATLGIA